jgi:ATP-dependent exoDNAse (exonuclease V) beta subunit
MPTLDSSNIPIFDSCWVSASAGSGKTKVLVDRVVRLLMQGEPLESLLCLTYTNAAAVEMRERIGKRLEELGYDGDGGCGGDGNRGNVGCDGGLNSVDWNRGVGDNCSGVGFGGGNSSSNGNSSGGPPTITCVYTIHSFCVEMINAFGFELGIFDKIRILKNSKSIIQSIQEESLEGAAEEEAVSVLLKSWSFDKINEVLSDLTRKRYEFSCFLKNYDPDEYETFLKEYLHESNVCEVEEFGKTNNSDSLVFDEKAVRDTAGALLGKLPVSASASDHTFLQNLSAGRFHEAFLTTANSLRKKLLTVKITNLFPLDAAFLQHQAGLFFAWLVQQKTKELIEKTQAVITLGAIILQKYQHYKQQNDTYDFEDLIMLGCELLERAICSAPLKNALFKRFPIKHIFLDEAQDTSPQQWQVVLMLVEAFFEDNRDEGAAMPRQQQLPSLAPPGIAQPLSSNSLPSLAPPDTAQPLSSNSLPSLEPPDTAQSLSSHTLPSLAPPGTAQPLSSNSLPSLAPPGTAQPLSSNSLPSLFVVGDIKQSIYSFQGARPWLFCSLEPVFQKMIEQIGGKWHHISLTRSYRTVGEILEVVDNIFTKDSTGLVFDGSQTKSRTGMGDSKTKSQDVADGTKPELQAGMGGVQTKSRSGAEESQALHNVATNQQTSHDLGYTKHTAARTDSGLVLCVDVAYSGDHENGLLSKSSESEFFEGGIEQKNAAHQATDADEGGCQNAQTAKKTAQAIQALLQNKTFLPSVKREITAGDILVLTRKRSELVGMLSDELAALNINVESSALLKFNQHLAWLDLLAFVRFLIYPYDDYNLACLIKSPFFQHEFRGEDQLFAACFGRGNPLFCGDFVEKSKLREYYDEFWKNTTAGDVSDYFYRVLADVRAGFVEEFGALADSIFDLFLTTTLEFMQSNGVDLHGLLDFLETLDASSGKLDGAGKAAQGERGDGVRFMTVHGSKGLQAPVVFVLDQPNRNVLQKENFIWFARDCDSLPLQTELTIKTSEPKYNPNFFNDENSGFLLLPAEAFAPHAALLAREQVKHKLLEENRRLLYVATTRAQDILVSVGDKGKGCEWHKAICECGGVAFGGLSAAEHGPAAAEYGPIVAKQGPIVAKQGPAAAEREQCAAEYGPIVAKQGPIMAKHGPIVAEYELCANATHASPSAAAANPAAAAKYTFRTKQQFSKSISKNSCVDFGFGSKTSKPTCLEEHIEQARGIVIHSLIKCAYNLFIQAPNLTKQQYNHFVADYIDSNFSEYRICGLTETVLDFLDFEKMLAICRHPFFYFIAHGQHEVSICDHGKIYRIDHLYIGAEGVAVIEVKTIESDSNIMLAREGYAKQIMKYCEMIEAAYGKASMPSQPSNKMPSQPSNKMPSQTPSKMPNQTSNKMPSQTPSKMLNQAPNVQDIGQFKVSAYFLWISRESAQFEEVLG